MQEERPDPIWGNEKPPTIEEIIDSFSKAENVCVVDDPMLPGFDVPEGTYRINITETYRGQIIQALKHFKREQDLLLEKLDTSVARQIKIESNKAKFAQAIVDNINVHQTCAGKAMVYKTQLLKLINALNTLEKFI